MIWWVEPVVWVLATLSGVALVHMLFSRLSPPPEPVDFPVGQFPRSCPPLQPCPWCGADAVLEVRFRLSCPNLYRVSCGGGPIPRGSCATTPARRRVEDAARDWNQVELADGDPL